MSVMDLLRKSLSRLSSNLVIIIPILAVGVVTALLSLILVGSLVPRFLPVPSEVTITADEAASVAGMAFGRLVAVMVFGSIVGLAGHGMTVLMASDALAGNPVRLADAWNRTMSRIVPLILTAVVVGILVSLGFLLLVIPGIVLMFFLMFSFVALMLEEARPFGAVASSFRLVKKHIGPVFVFFLVLIAIGVLTGIVGTVLGMIPFLGAILSVLLGTVFGAFSTVFLVAVYNDLSTIGDATVDPEA